jgi:hypothetical protein
MGSKISWLSDKSLAQRIADKAVAMKKSNNLNSLIPGRAQVVEIEE